MPGAICVFLGSYGAFLVLLRPSGVFAFWGILKFLGILWVCRGLLAGDNLDFLGLWLLLKCVVSIFDESVCDDII